MQTLETNASEQPSIKVSMCAFQWLNLLFIYIQWPFRYSTIVTRRRAYVAVFLCWILSFLTGLVPMIGWNNHDAFGNRSTYNDIVCEFTAVMKMDYMVYFNFFGWVVLPLAIMITLYGEIFRVIRRQLNRRAEATCDGDRYYRKELKLAKSLALVVFLFAVCWLPIHIMNCISFFCSECYIPKYAIYVGIFMSHVNSALNPMVYAFRIKRFRVTLIQITRHCMLCKPAEPTPFLTSTPALSTKVNVNHLKGLQLSRVNGAHWEAQIRPVFGLTYCQLSFITSGLLTHFIVNCNMRVQKGV